VGRLIPSVEDGWPQWRGPRRDGISEEKGLLQAWPEGGPALLWTATGLGRGYSSPVISQGTLWITGDVGQELHVFGLDLSGKLRWRATNGAAWSKNFRGARASCCYSDGCVYRTKELAMGSAIWADSRFYLLSQVGDMALAEPTDEGFEFAGRFRLVEKRVNDAWAHPVLLDGRLYLRYHDKLRCHDVKAK